MSRITERLPERFEKEVLWPACIWWKEYNDTMKDRGYSKTLPHLYFGNEDWVTHHEIAAIGLEVVGCTIKAIPILDDGYRFVLIKYSDDFKEITCRIVDKDFCQCVFKAIKEIYA